MKADGENMENSERRIVLPRGFDKLTHIEQEVLLIWLGTDDGCPRSVGETARKMNMTRERVMYIIHRAVRADCLPKKIKPLRDFLD